MKNFILINIYLTTKLNYTKNMKEKIKKRLNEIYEEQVHLTDKNRVWIQPDNCVNRNDLIKINYVLIQELENLLKL